jgi:hypothetical protein
MTSTSSNIDLDINNYSIGDLFKFFKLNQKSCVYTDVDKTAQKMSFDISHIPDMNPIYKASLLNFINQAKRILFSTMLKNENFVPQQVYDFIDNTDDVINDDNNNKKSISNDNTSSLKNSVFDSKNYLNNNDNPNIVTQIQTTKKLAEVVNNLAKILNPLSNHPALQTHSIPSNNVLPYNAKTYRANYVFNTQYRDNFYTTGTEACSFTLPLKLKNVVEITLSAIQMTNVMFTFSPSRHTDQIYIYEEDTAINGIVTIPKGNYDTTTFADILEKAINEQLLGSWPNRFKVSISPYTYFTTISNTTHNFRMNLLSYKSDINDYCYYKKYNINGNPDTISFIDIKNGFNVTPSDFCSTMGYLIGYRQPIYIGSNSYTSESMFNGSFTDYVYFCVDDYVASSQYIVNYGIFADAIVDNNILGVIPITSAQFQSTFGSGADFIYKSRKYNGPVDIQKISIKILDGQGHLVNMHKYDYSFGLEVVTICDISEPFKHG